MEEHRSLTDPCSTCQGWGQDQEPSWSSPSRRSKDHGALTLEGGSLVRKVLRMPWGELGRGHQGGSQQDHSSQDTHFPGQATLSQNKALTGPCSNVCC